MRSYDFARTRLIARTSRKQQVLAFMDGLIAIFALSLFLYVLGVVFYVIS